MLRYSKYVFSLNYVMMADTFNFVNGQTKNMSFFVLGPPPPPQWARDTSITRFLDHTQRRTTFGRTPLDE